MYEPGTVIFIAHEGNVKGCTPYIIIECIPPGSPPETHLEGIPPTVYPIEWSFVCIQVGSPKRIHAPASLISRTPIPPHRSGEVTPLVEFTSVHPYIREYIGALEIVALEAIACCFKIANRCNVPPSYKDQLKRLYSNLRNTIANNPTSTLA